MDQDEFFFRGLGDRKRAMERLLEVGMDLVSGTQGAYLCADESGRALRFETVALRHGMPEALRTVSMRLIGQVVRFGEGVTGRAAVTRCTQLESRTESNAMFRVSGDSHPNAVMASPVVRAGRVVGVITAVCFDREKSFSEESCRRYSMLAEVAAGLLT